MKVQFLLINKSQSKNEISRTLEVRNQWIIENKSILGKYKYAVMEEVLKYAMQDHFRMGSADSSRYEAVNSIFSNLQKLDTARFLILAEKISLKEERKTNYFKSCSFSAIRDQASKQKKMLILDTAMAFIMVSFLGIMTRIFVDSSTVRGLSCITLFTAMFIVVFGNMLLRENPEHFMELHNFSKKIGAQDAGKIIYNLSEKSIYLFLQSARRLERALPAPEVANSSPHRQVDTNENSPLSTITM